MRWPRFDWAAFLSCSSLVPFRITSSRCSAACGAIWAPIEPAPTTVNRFTRGPREIEDFVGYSLHGKDSRHRVQRHDIGKEPVDFELATQQLRRHASPDLVVVDGKPEQPDLQVAQTHHGFGLGADGESALRLEAVVDGELFAL